jgi:hypothetical protein
MSKLADLVDNLAQSTFTGPNAKVFTCPGSFRASKADCQERDNEAHRQKHRRGLGPIFRRTLRAESGPIGQLAALV